MEDYAYVIEFLPSGSGLPITKRAYRSVSWYEIFTLLEALRKLS